MPTSSEELRRRIVADINAGDPGAKLGSERELAERYNTSRSSLRQVLAALEEAGLVHRVIGRSGGIFISHAQVQRSLYRRGRRAGFPCQPGLRRGNPRDFDEDHCAGPHHAEGVVHRRRTTLS